MIFKYALHDDLKWIDNDINQAVWYDLIIIYNNENFTMFKTRSISPFFQGKKEISPTIPPTKLSGIEHDLVIQTSEDIKIKMELLLEILSNKVDDIRFILSVYQTYDVTDYEIERSIRTINGLIHGDMFQDVSRKIESAAVLLPSNLPLYSLIIFALIPSILSSRVFVRPNSILQEHNIITKLYDALDLGVLFPSVQIINQGHAGFREHIQSADLVTFTGKPSNSDKLLQDMKSESLLVINGSGHNPLVVTDTADIDRAVEAALVLKGFNGGQDCAGPDAILVHAHIAKEFIEKFHQRFSMLKTGSFDVRDTIIGPIHRLTELQKFAGIFHSNRNDIISGGVIDFRRGIVEPTVIVRGIERYPNYSELYGPVAFIHPYKTDEDLSYYFQDFDGQYNANRMYVSVYGHSDYLSRRDDTINPGLSGNVGILLHNQTIHDVEIGYKSYGGYSLGASGIIKKSSAGVQRMAMPIYIPDVIVTYLINKADFPFERKKEAVFKTACSSTLRGQEINPVILDFKTIALESFGENVLFGFVFGSAAKGKLKTKGIDKDDLDTFICLNNDDKDAIARYHHRLVDLHLAHDLKVDEVFPAEIMTIEKLRNIIDNLDVIDVSIDTLIEGEKCDHIFWTHALTDQKTGFIGQGKIMSDLIKKTMPHIYRWRNQVIEQLEKAEYIPLHVEQRFVGLNKQEILQKLVKFSPHLIIHLGLNYDDNGMKATL